jgi:hypothetical protein
VPRLRPLIECACFDTLLSQGDNATLNRTVSRPTAHCGGSALYELSGILELLPVASRHTGAMRSPLLAQRRLIATNRASLNFGLVHAP